MRTKLVSIQDFKGHEHPASKLFRMIELRTVYKNTKNMKFSHPSLDLGGGDGYLSSILFDDRFTYNLDNGEAKDLHIAKRTKRYKHILIESAEHMSLKANTLSFVFSNSVIEHIPDNEAVLSEVARTLKKGGVFVFTSPSHLFKEQLYLSNKLRNTPLAFLGHWYKEKRNKLLNHYHTYSHKTWQKKLKKHGLIVKKYQYYISKDHCMLWDKIALEVRLRGLFDKQAEKHVFDKYYDRILNAIATDKVVKDQGASLFIYAIKK